MNADEDKDLVKFEDLPNDLICKIATYLDYYRKNLALTSRRNNELIKESIKNRNIYNEDQENFSIKVYNYSLSSNQTKLESFFEFLDKNEPIRIFNSVFRTVLTIINSKLTFLSNYKGFVKIIRNLGNNYKVFKYITLGYIVIDLYLDKTFVYYFDLGEYSEIIFNSKVDTILIKHSSDSFMGFFSKTEYINQPSSFTNKTIKAIEKDEYYEIKLKNKDKYLLGII